MLSSRSVSERLGRLSGGLFAAKATSTAEKSGHAAESAISKPNLPIPVSQCLPPAPSSAKAAARDDSSEGVTERGEEPANALAPYEVPSGREHLLSVRAFALILVDIEKKLACGIFSSPDPLRCEAMPLARYCDFDRTGYVDVLLYCMESKS